MAWIYASAWLAYACLFVLLVLSTGGASPGRAIEAAAVNVTPLALLGVPVILWCRKIGPAALHPRFVGLHLGAGLLYAFPAIAISDLLFAFRSPPGGTLAGLDLSETRLLGLRALTGLVSYATLAAFAYAWHRRERVSFPATREPDTTRASAGTDPRLLFDALHSLLELARRDPSAADRSLEQFSDLVHYVLRAEQGRSEEVSLRAEWEFVDDYLSLERARLGERLRLSIQLDPGAFDCLVPAFILLPLVENAVRHGIAPLETGGTVSVRSEIRQQELLITVTDDGPGSDLGRIAGDDGLGLPSVRERLAAIHGERARLSITTRASAGLTARLSLPLRRRKGKGDRSIFRSGK